MQDIVERNPAELLTSLAKCLVNDNVVAHFNKLVELGIWDVLFPNPIPLQKRTEAHDYLTDHFQKTSETYTSLRKEPLNTVNKKIKQLNRRVYDGIVVAELFTEMKSSPADIASKLQELYKRSPLISTQTPLHANLLEEAKRLKEMFDGWHSQKYVLKRANPRSSAKIS